MPSSTCRIFSLAMLLGIAPSLMAQQADTTSAVDSVVTVPVATPAPVLRDVGAPVVLGGDTVLRVFAGIGVETAADRARAIADRLDRLRTDPTVERDTMRIVEDNAEIRIMLGEAPVMMVLPGDAVGADLPRSVLAVQYRDALGAAFQSGAATGRAKTLLIGIGLALLATLAALALAWLLRQVVVRARRLLGLLRASKRLPSLKIQNLEVISADRIADAGLAALEIIRVIAWAVLGYFYVVLVLSLFTWSRPLSGRILGYVTQPLGVVGGSVVAYLPNLFFIAVIIIVTRWVLQLIRLVFEAIRLGRLALPGFERDWADPTYKLVRFLVLAFALVVLFPYLPGSKSDAFKGVSVFMAILVSLGSTGAVANLVSGTLLTYTKSFNVGDRVRIGDVLGDVSGRSLLVTRIRTLTNVEVTIPNAQVMNGQVLNFTTNAASPGVALQATITIGYDVPWRQVHELLIAAAVATEGIATDPAPLVLQTGLEDNYPAYELNAFTNDAASMRVTLSRLHGAIQDQFAQAGVEITSPAYLAMRDGNTPTIPKVG
jgi:small-conductance mechanosensitive channel